MPEPTTQELIDSMVGPSTSRLGELAATMSGTGAETVALFRDISSAVSQLPGLGMSAAEKIRTTNLIVGKRFDYLNVSCEVSPSLGHEKTQVGRVSATFEDLAQTP